MSDNKVNLPYAFDWVFFGMCVAPPVVLALFVLFG